MATIAGAHGAALVEEDEQGLDPEAQEVRQTDAEQRRIFGSLLAHEFYAQNNVRRHARFVRNRRGMRLYSQVWEPASAPPSALLCCCHGFGNDTSWLFQLTCVQLASAGYAVCALEYEGHGRSDGLRCSIRTLDTFVDDCIDYFASIRQRPEYLSLPCFLFGESMGGAICLLVLSKTHPEAVSAVPLAQGSQQQQCPSLHWDGLVLVSPMLIIADNMRPHWLVSAVLHGLAYIAPDAAIVPSPNPMSISFKDKERLELCLANPMRYKEQPRLQAAVELLRATDKVTELLPRVSVPFLVVHGDADPVTDCEGSKKLVNLSASRDKTLKLIPGGAHQLLQGELKESREEIWAEVLSWLAAHVASRSYLMRLSSSKIRSS